MEQSTLIQKYSLGNRGFWSRNSSAVRQWAAAEAGKTDPEMHGIPDTSNTSCSVLGCTNHANHRCSLDTPNWWSRIWPTWPLSWATAEDHCWQPTSTNQIWISAPPLHALVTSQPLAATPAVAASMHGDRSLWWSCKTFWQHAFLKAVPKKTAFLCRPVAEN